jgi:hypothetical protein
MKNLIVVSCPREILFVLMVHIDHKPVNFGKILGVKIAASQGINLLFNP